MLQHGGCDAWFIDGDHLHVRALDRGYQLSYLVNVPGNAYSSLITGYVNVGSRDTLHVWVNGGYHCTTICCQHCRHLVKKLPG